MRFSIIVPACNVAPFVGRTLNSIRQQINGDFEVLVLCETSRDATLRRVREVSGDDSRFTVVELPCSGSASVSRNYGIEHARGDYLVFVDGDDWLEIDALARLDAAIAAADEPDLVLTAYRNWQDTPTGPQPCGGELSGGEPGDVLSGPAALTELFRTGRFRPATWRYLYRRTWLKASGLQQLPGRRHQDDEWTPRVFIAAARVLFTDVVCCNYLRRSASATTTPSPESLRDASDNLAALWRYRRQNRNWSRDLRRSWARWHWFGAIRYFSPAWEKRYSAAACRREFRRLMHTPGGVAGLLTLWPDSGGRDRLSLLPLLAAAWLPVWSWRPLAWCLRRLYRLNPASGEEAR